PFLRAEPPCRLLVGGIAGEVAHRVLRGALLDLLAVLLHLTTNADRADADALRVLGAKPRGCHLAAADERLGSAHLAVHRPPPGGDAPRRAGDERRPFAGERAEPDPGGRAKVGDRERIED